MVVWILLLLLVAIFMISSCNLKTYGSSEPYQGGGYYNVCELNDACRWDTARWCTMTDGSQGNCTLHGKCCPAFSMDHSRTRTWGLSPSMVTLPST